MFRWLTENNLAERFDPASQEEVLMTGDEWRAQGVDFALSAEDDEGVDSTRMLQRAVKCFTQAGETSLLALASAQLQISVCKASLGGELTPDNENQVAAAALCGWKAGMGREVRALCAEVTGRVCNPMVFRQQVLVALDAAIGDV
jgi:hypothetical protein